MGFLNRNQSIAERRREPVINDAGLAALTLLVAESDPKQKKSLDPAYHAHMLAHVRRERMSLTRKYQDFRFFNQENEKVGLTWGTRGCPYGMSFQSGTCFIYAYGGVEANYTGSLYGESIDREQYPSLKMARIRRCVFQRIWEAKEELEIIGEVRYDCSSSFKA